MTNILVYYIQRTNDYEKDVKALTMSETELQDAGIFKQIFFPITTGNPRIESVHLPS